MPITIAITSDSSMVALTPHTAVATGFYTRARGVAHDACMAIWAQDMDRYGRLWNSMNSVQDKKINMVKYFLHAQFFLAWSCNIM